MLFFYYWLLTWGYLHSVTARSPARHHLRVRRAENRSAEPRGMMFAVAPLVRSDGQQSSAARAWPGTARTHRACSQKGIGLRYFKATALLLSIVTLLLVTQLNLLPNGVSFSGQRRALNKLKNRPLPAPETDYDNRVTLEGLLQPGDDRTRWAETAAARVEGYVVSVRDGSIESANCYSFFRRDTHIEVALNREASPRERVELEVTPRTRAWAEGRGWDWSTGTLRKELIGHWCQFEGWLLFDIGHDEESENINPGGAKNWRATAWELHPVTAIKVIR